MLYKFSTEWGGGRLCMREQEIGRERGSETGGSMAGFTASGVCCDSGAVLSADGCTAEKSFRELQTSDSSL